MFGFEFGEGGGGVGGEAFEDHLEALAAAGGDFVQGTDFVLLQGILVQVVECAFVVHQMVPVADHAEVADLGIDPAALVEGVFAAAQAGDEGSAVQFQLLGGGDADQLEEGGIKVGEVD